MKHNQFDPTVPVPGFEHGVIESRARMLWEQRGRPTGWDLEIWLAAEAELRAESRADDERRPRDVEAETALEPASGDSARNRSPTVRGSDGRLPAPHSRR